MRNLLRHRLRRLGATSAIVGLLLALSGNMTATAGENRLRVIASTTDLGSIAAAAASRSRPSPGRARTCTASRSCPRTWCAWLAPMCT
jgi:hypothetical protein